MTGQKVVRLSQDRTQKAVTGQETWQGKRLAEQDHVTGQKFVTEQMTRDRD
jgi:hypothetical protein